MKQTNKFLMALALTAIAFTSCKKDDDGSPNTGGDITGSYKLTALTKLVAGQEVNYMPMMDECSLDDIVTFKANKTYQYADKGLACNPSGNDEGTWSLKGADSLVIDGFAVKIVSKTNNQLVLLGDRSTGDFDLVFKTTYKKL